MIDDEQGIVRQAPRGADDALLHTNGFTWFIPNVRPDDEVGILAGMPVGSPLAVAFSTGGTVLIGAAVVPIPATSLKSVGISAATRFHKGQWIMGTAVRLPAFLARIHTCWDALKRGASYDVKRALEGYCADLTEEVGKVVQNRVMRDLLDGLQAQASTDIRLRHGMVGMSEVTAALLHRRLSAQDSAIRALKTLHGLTVLIERFPTANAKSLSWARIVILQDVPDFQLLFCPEEWEDDKGGDTDGDQGYVVHDGAVEVIETPNLGAYPILQRVEFERASGLLSRLVVDWRPATKAAEVERVMAMLIKDLTGSLDYAFHCMGRAYAVKSAKDKTTEAEIKQAFKDGYLKVFGLYFPIQEAVMNARKMEGGLPALRALAAALGKAMTGETLDPQVFAPLLTADQYVALRSILKAIGYSLSLTRLTAFGVLVAAGRKKERAIERLLKALECSAPEFLRILQDDAVGNDLRFLKVSKGRRASDEDGKEKSVDQLHIAAHSPHDRTIAGDSTLAVFRSIVYGDKEVFTGLRFSEPFRPGQLNVVVGHMIPWWRDGAGQLARWRVEVTMPAVVGCGDNGHCLVSIGGMSARFFRPRFRLVDGDLVKVGIAQVLREALLAGVQQCCVRSGGKGQKCSTLINAAMRSVVQGATVRRGNPDEEGEFGGMLPSGPLLNLVHQFEYEVETTPTKDVVASWQERESILTRLAEDGYDVLATSKGKPGSVVTKGPKGVAPYLSAMNPFARYLDPKRRVEPREVRRALPLCSPEPLGVKALGTRVPPAMGECITHLTCCILDCNANTFQRLDGSVFRHDTVLVTPQGVDKLAIRELELIAVDYHQLGRLKERLDDLGYGEEFYTVTEEPFDLGDGMRSCSYVVRLKGPILDVGKIKACIGPLKGIMTVIPHRLVARHQLPGGGVRERVVHSILSLDTIERKKGLDTLLYMLADKAGISTVDPEMDLGTLVQDIETKLLAAEEHPEGMEEVICIDSDGNEHSIGMAMVGRVPFFRPPQTVISTFACRTGGDGIPVQVHAMTMADLEHSTPQRVVERFTYVLETRDAVQRLITVVPESGGSGGYDDRDAAMDLESDDWGTVDVTDDVDDGEDAGWGPDDPYC